MQCVSHTFAVGSIWRISHVLSSESNPDPHHLWPFLFSGEQGCVSSPITGFCVCSWLTISSWLLLKLAALVGGTHARQIWRTWCLQIKRRGDYRLNKGGWCNFSKSCIMGWDSHLQQVLIKKTEISSAFWLVIFSDEVIDKKERTQGKIVLVGGLCPDKNMSAWAPAAWQQHQLCPTWEPL